MKTQKITKSALKEIYPKACNDWQKKIAELVLFSEDGKMIEVDNNLVIEAHKASSGNKECKQWLEKNFKIVSGNIIDRIKTWEDVLKEKGLDEDEVLTHKNPKTKKQKFQNACDKLQLIHEVLNEGWIPDFNNTNQYKYYPWFKKVGGRWVYDCYCYCGDYGAIVGFGFYLKNSELSIYSGNQFLDIWVDYLPE